MKCDFCNRTDDECKIKKVKNNYFCPKHLSRFYRGQNMNMDSIYDKNEYIIYDDF